MIQFCFVLCIQDILKISRFSLISKNNYFWPIIIGQIDYEIYATRRSLGTILSLKYLKENWEKSEKTFIKDPRTCQWILLFQYWSTIKKKKNSLPDLQIARSHIDCYAANLKGSCPGLTEITEWYRLFHCQQNNFKNCNIFFY